MSNVLNGTGNTIGKLKGSLQVAYGKEGKSAYEVAVVNGFEGTEQEWLDTLSGVYLGSGEMPEEYNVQIDPNGEAFPNYCERTEYERAYDINVEVIPSNNAFIYDEYNEPKGQCAYFSYGGNLKPNTKYKIFTKQYFEALSSVYPTQPLTPYIALEELDNIAIPTEDVQCLYDMDNYKWVEITFTTPEEFEYNTLHIVFTANGSDVGGLPSRLTFNIYEVEHNYQFSNVYTKEEVDTMLGEIIEALKGCSVSSAKIGEVTLTADGWVGEESPYSQVVTIEGVTENSQVDLTPSVEQLSIFYEKDLTFVTENEGGVVTIYAIGQKPQNDYTIQVTITEIEGVITSG